jgi:predicted TIM-barrel fold metal-dependent hydrolase
VIESLEIPDADKAKIFHGNAEKLLKLAERSEQEAHRTEAA